MIRPKSPNRPSRWWSKARGLSDEVYTSLTESLRAEGRPVERILAWATTDSGFCVGFPALLSTGGTEGWTHIGWHEIESGGWNSETRQLSWRGYDGKRGYISLAEPARLPELFRERVAASIAVEKFFALDGKRGVTVSGRRDLADPASEITWHSTLTRGLTWQTEGVREAAETATNQVRTEYDFR